MAAISKQQKTWKEYNLSALKDIEQKYFHTVPDILPMGDTQEEALRIIAQAFDVSQDRPVKLVPIFGLSLIVSFELLKHIVEKRQNGRERFALFTQKTLMSPYEVWRTAMMMVVIVMFILGYLKIANII